MYIVEQIQSSGSEKPTSFRIAPTPGFALTTFSNPKVIKNLRLFVDTMLLDVNFAVSPEGLFVVPTPEIPFAIGNRNYYWHPSFHPPLEVGTKGCMLPITHLAAIAKTMPSFHIDNLTTHSISKSTLAHFLGLLHLVDRAIPPEISWYCRRASCCELGCCSGSEKVPNSLRFSQDLEPSPPTFLQNVFVYTWVFFWFLGPSSRFSCLAFLTLCILTLFGSMIAFVFKDLFYRYFSWSSSANRSSCPEIRTQQPTPTSVLQRSPSRSHLTV